jgi:hypothetical protein
MHGKYINACYPKCLPKLSTWDSKDNNLDTFTFFSIQLNPGLYAKDILLLTRELWMNLSSRQTLD